MLPILRAMFPDKPLLSVEDVARVLNRTGAGGYEQTREQLAAGVIVPGLRKLGGSWLVPVTALAEALDGLTDTDAAGQATPKALPTRHTVTRANPILPRKGGRIPDRAKHMALADMTSLAFAMATFDASAFWGEVLALLEQPLPRPALTATPADCFAEPQPWVRQDGRLVGHGQLLPVEERDSALDTGELWEGTLADALLEPWASVDARDPYDEALEGALAVYERARSDRRSQDRAHAMERGLPPATGPSPPRKPFRF
ncbi:hypothetical protein [Coralloluteibacterium stylophorae]|uniref:Uncharacterized protein n=1 Tax=Coralloluteibacterium stylophorae TaxID=1776034 RepID=A0AAP2G351_9GAMM|nr:hypothetical protein [Coralloluteibacterium stylophorae]MBS7458898.1 hypothetical protein [Coralloluteibacterium stylophorae]